MGKMKVLRVNITCKKCGQKGFMEFNFRLVIWILIKLMFGQITTSIESD